MKDIENRITDIMADAMSIKTLVLDVTDNPSDEDGNRLHAILKLSEDQIRTARGISDMLV